MQGGYGSGDGDRKDRGHREPRVLPADRTDSAGGGSMVSSGDGRGGNAAERRMELARAWERTLAEVRRLPGFRDFLAPPGLDVLTAAASAGPVAVLTVSRWRCFALVVRPEGVEAVAYPGLTLTAVVQRANDYLKTLQQVEHAKDEADRALCAFAENPGPSVIRRRKAAVRALLDAHDARERTLRSLLAWLWDEIAEPVLSALGEASGSPAEDDTKSPWTRLWWCPTGPLTFLPLHAAGHHDAPAVRGADTVLDRVISSYTPTLRALERARARTPAAAKVRAAPGDGEGRMLVVALPDSPGQVSLESAAHDRDLLAELFPDERHTLLQGPDATRAAVLRELRRSPWAHFSCHGTQNLVAPSTGGFLLHDGVLSVEDIGAGSYPGSFAFLSACKTATGGTGLPDEVITLAAALHYTGYRHVIATLWSVRDDDAATFSSDVYRRLCHGGTFDPDRSAHAVHEATRNLRSATDDLSAWTPFTHTGP
ncbi:CHAT domain-containing protein [Streptomyces xinghaiensis]|uniref:CHAT domain-containing protein n=2 Tax=Streptomyces TaxID=1883 RepID=A0A3R7HKY5_9ACTN|nr:hypothetical protein BEN35_06260 [Streptomyces fradiae]RKM97908.1 CHAT domain-containing protein [Streptomyces xinghaiensis]RNC73955.1 CHAT domain-containing protein [Streptomyces xinghaiensis]